MPRAMLLILVTAALTAACALSPDAYEGAAAPRAAPIVPIHADRPLLGLALGGGGARGFAHVGVIKALEAGGIVPDIVTGSSSGAVIAALYAAGHDGRRLEEIALDLAKGDLVDVVLFGRGWVRGEALQDFVNRMVNSRPIERLDRPFAAVATAARSGRMTVFNRGDTGLAVRASASVPNLFVPPVIEGEEYVDGGLTSPVPVRVAREMGADVIIAVDVSWFARFGNRDGGSMGRFARSERYGLLTGELAAADIVVSPRTPPSRLLDFDGREAHIAAGEAAARDVAPRVRELLARAAAARRAAAAAALSH
ncbi:MAG: patatin-like phospholipase family protein [Burkholderiales bacterium]|nr:patatin-like phospholipase family protein [Burkholderiales bacterium]